VLLMKKDHMSLIHNFTKILSFSNALAAVKIGKEWGFVDKKGSYVINPQFVDAHSFMDGLAAIKKGKEWGFY